MSAFLFCTVLAVQAQTAQPASANIYIPPKPLISEDNAVRMEYVRNLMTTEPNSDGVIIIIARLGRGETRKNLNY